MVTNNDSENKLSNGSTQIGRTGPVIIEMLNIRGVSAQDVQTLQAMGILTIERLLHTPKKDLKPKTGWNDAKVEKIMAEATKLVPVGFQPASAILIKRNEIIQVTTGCDILDELLKGGIDAGSITEVYGEFRCGKTQLCHALAVTCQLPVKQGGAEGKCLYIDTENSFRPERLVQIAERFELMPKVCLDNVAYARAYSSDHQAQLLNNAAKMMTESRFALIVVDSATALFRSDYSGRGELNARQDQLGRFLRGLQKLADEFGVAVVVTNQVTAANVGRSGGFPCTKAIGGNIMAHATTTRLCMSKAKGNARKVKLVASPSLPEKIIEVLITREGILDRPPQHST